MIIIWSGLGILVPVLTILVLCLTQFAADATFGEGFYTAHGVPKLLAFWISAALMWLIGNALAKKQGRVLYDPQTGQHVELKPRHSFFFIQVAYWAYILVFLGIVFFFV